MEKVVILGSANAVASENRQNTHLFVIFNERRILVDCPGNPIVQLKKAGIDPHSITDIVLTHFHPDHVSGYSLLLLDLWLLGRETPLNVYGFEHTISRAQKMMDLFSWQSWPGFFEVRYHIVKVAPLTEIFSDENLRLLASPVKHLLPTMGLRFESQNTDAVFTYSSDTEPTQAVIDLAKDADVLIHEANGVGIGHSSSAQCGQIAEKAGVKHLYLIHYPSGTDKAAWINEAKEHFMGEVDVCVDLLTINLD